jgi:hypothetical protein
MWIFEVYLSKEDTNPSPKYRDIVKRIEVLVTAFGTYKGFILNKDEELISKVEKCYLSRLFEFKSEEGLDFDDPLWAKFKECENITDFDIDFEKDGYKLSGEYYVTDDQMGAIQEAVSSTYGNEWDSLSVQLTLDFRDRNSDLDDKYYKIYEEKLKLL